MAMTGRTKSNWTVENVLRPVMIAAMLACLSSPLVYISRDLNLDYNASHFVVFAFFAGLEGILAERVLRRRRITGWAYLGSRLAEVVVLLLLLKLSTYLSLGFEQLRFDAQLWLSDPAQFASSLDVVLAAVLIFMWAISLHVARMVMELDIAESRDRPPDDRTSVDYYLWSTKPSLVRERQETLDWLTEIIVWGGIALLVASAIVHVVMGSTRALAVPMLLYFALGVTLLAQARFSVVHVGWHVQGIDVHPQVARRWLVWAVLFLVGVSLATLALPSYYTLGPLQAFLGLLSMLFTVLSFLITLLFFLLMLPLAWLIPDVEVPRAPALVPPSTPPQTSAASVQSPWIQVLASAAFWIVVSAIVGYAFVRFWRDRVGQQEDGEGAAGGLWARFLTWVRALWKRWWDWRQEVQEQLALRRSRRRAGEPLAGRLSHLFFPGRLPPRELIRFFYLSAARRAEQAGQPRRSHQTPYEYRETLDERFPELEPDLEGLTDAFVQARYSRQPVESEQAVAVKPLWERVKAALRRRRT